ncbi:MAG: IS1380 family transposase [Rhodococcus sp. (in: high G+C Gram-positive bacteria)]|nr:MAG: IS1380 family transposase [Rhodococcus sp. (in: high G+C Gram-positive bacteria)]
MQSSHTFTAESAVFDERNLVSSAGLVPVLELAEQAGLSELIDTHVRLDSTRVASGAVNPVGKLTSIIAGMCTGADVIDDMNPLRAGGMPALLDQVYAPSTLGIFLREFTFGHSLQLGSVLRRHLIALAARTPLLPGIAERAFLDIDSLLRPVYGHQKQGASYGHAKIAGRALLRKGLSPLVTTLSTAQAAPVITEIRLRAGKTGSGRGAASQLRSAITTARACGAHGKIMVRGDSAFGNKAVIGAAVAAGIEFSLVMTRNPRITQAIDGIDEHKWMPVHYPGAVIDPETGELISDAEVAETSYTAFSGRHRVTARLIVRRVKDANYPDALFPVWRYHPFFTNSDLSTVEADITHRKHAIVETVFADLIDGPLAHIPSGRFGANSAWVLCAAITHNLLRAAGTLAGGHHAVARGASLRRHLVNVPARFARPARKPVLHLPAHWPRQAHWTSLWDNTIDYTPPQAA